MNETMICAVGNVATQPAHRDLASGPSARFRLAVTARYLDREKNEWTDGHTNFFTVWARRQLATHVTASLNVGDPVIVQGRLKVRTDAREGQNWASADLEAVAIGHDLTRGRRPSGGRAGRMRGRLPRHSSSPSPTGRPRPENSGTSMTQREPEPAAVT